ncbi:MAG: HIT family protein [Bacteroidetes bacterium]|nr:MAG: HIT family protein [Bacteroidota bacterium]
MATIFTKIIEGEIPCYKIAENEGYFAFLDIRPAAKGHTLVVPKRETDYLFDLEAADFSGLMLFARRVAKAMDRALQPIRTGVVVEGLEVPHAHVHLIPIYREGQHAALGNPVDVTAEEMEAVAERIRVAWGDVGAGVGAGGDVGVGAGVDAGGDTGQEAGHEAGGNP